MGVKIQRALGCRTVWGCSRGPQDQWQRAQGTVASPHEGSSLTEHGEGALRSGDCHHKTWASCSQLHRPAPPPAPESHSRCFLVLKCSPSPVLVNKCCLEHSHVHFFPTICGCSPTTRQSRVAMLVTNTLRPPKLKIFTIVPFQKVRQSLL